MYLSSSLLGFLTFLRSDIRWFWVDLKLFFSGTRDLKYHLVIFICWSTSHKLQFEPSFAKKFGAGKLRPFLYAKVVALFTPERNRALFDYSRCNVVARKKVDHHVRIAGALGRSFRQARKLAFISDQKIRLPHGESYERKIVVQRRSSKRDAVVSCACA